MGRAILLACLPWLALFVATGVALLLLVRVNRGRFRWRRLLLLHRDQTGSAQSLSFVLTLPFFIMLLLFIVQVSQLMIASVAVHYAAFAAARSAVVWIPQRLSNDEIENVVPWYAPDPDATDQHFPVLDPDDPNYGPAEGGVTYLLLPGSLKYQKISEAALLALLPIAPSRGLGRSLPAGGENLVHSLHAAYATLAPNAEASQAIRRRIRNKLAYANSASEIEVRFFHANSEPPLVTHLVGADVDQFRMGMEMGWQDHVTVTVKHDLALLPGPGRLLARAVFGEDGSQDRLSQTIRHENNVYTYPLTATAKLGIEGEISVLPYVYQVN